MQFDNLYTHQYKHRHVSYVNLNREAKKNWIKMLLFLQMIVSAWYANFNYLRVVARKVLWSSACVCLSVCAHFFLSARYLKNGFMDHHQIWWVGAGGEPLEQVQFWR